MSGAASEQRAAKRHTLLLRAAKLISAAGEQICILRDASSGGIRLRLFSPLSGNGPHFLELGSGARYAIRQVWSSGEHAGFCFADGEIGLTPFIQEHGPFPRRQIRLRAVRPVQVVANDGARPAELRDISLDGFRIECDWRYPLGQELRIEAPGLPDLTGRVRWRLRSAHGIVLTRRFALDELARLLQPPPPDDYASSIGLALTG